MSNKKQWRAWVIKRNRYENVIGYIKEHVPEVDKYFYPMVKQEYQTKIGSKIKDRPLYEGYLFLRYDNPDEVYHKLNANPFVTTYAGTVDTHEIENMESVQGKLISEIKSSRFKKGDVVTLLSGPFKDFDAVVQSVEIDQIRVKIDAKILGQDGVNLVFPDDEIEHRSKLQNASVQSI